MRFSYTWFSLSFEPEVANRALAKRVVYKLFHFVLSSLHNYIEPCFNELLSVYRMSASWYPCMVL